MACLEPCNTASCAATAIPHLPSTIETPHFLLWHQPSTILPGLVFQGNPVSLPSKVLCRSLYVVPIPREEYFGPPYVKLMQSDRDSGAPVPMEEA